ncbi:MAG: sulfite exporter TauE/SafE family protein, partial [Candidatus Hydrogenedentes bacterium]|nr:sulfite exporter TauE/SafE family protein [Candidatus Hydrogenedentota bacterium]
TVFSMIGMGGGILYLPVLLFAGFSFKDAPAISLILIVATSTAALFTFWRNRKIDWKLALVIDPATDVMAFVGGYFSALISESILRGILAGVLMIAGTLMLKDKLRRDTSKIPGGGGWWLWNRSFNGVNYTVNLPLVLTAAVFIGILSGMLGVTGGMIKLPIMVLLCGVPMDIAIATSTIMVAATALSGLAGHAVNGQVDWRTGLVLAIVAVMGGLIGSKISISMNKVRLKKIFGLIVWLLAIHIVIQLFT